MLVVRLRQQRWPQVSDETRRLAVPTAPARYSLTVYHRPLHTEPSHHQPHHIAKTRPFLMLVWGAIWVVGVCLMSIPCILYVVTDFAPDDENIAGIPTIFMRAFHSWFALILTLLSFGGIPMWCRYCARKVRKLPPPLSEPVPPPSPAPSPAPVPTPAQSLPPTVTRHPTSDPQEPWL